MGVEVRPFGVRCNIACQYCYQNPERDAGNELTGYDLERMEAGVLAEGRPFILFGGEPLIMPTADLERLWAFGLEQFGQNGIQTNGTLLDDEHIRLFKNYRVAVGISVDGPGELNDVRWAGTLEKTRTATSRTQAAIERLCSEGIPPSLIVTLHRNNATCDRLPAMHDWLRRLADLGVKSVRLHLLEIDDERVRQKYALSTEENLDAMLSFLELERELGAKLRFDVFDDMRAMLLGDDDEGTCVWKACDPYTTAAVRGVEGNGQRSNCGRTNKDGIDFVKSDHEGFERYIALYQTPQRHGGCSGCRFFLMCKGQCPGTAIDRDWRNRTEHCEVWMGLLEVLETELLASGRQPLSLSEQRQQIEDQMLSAWSQGHSITISTAVKILRPAGPAPAEDGRP
jgi:uncharacterized protein